MRTRDEVLREFGYTFPECANPTEKLMADRIAQQDARIRELEADAKRLDWLEAASVKEDRDGGWVGFFALPLVSAWDETPYSRERGMAHDHANLRAAIDYAMTTEVDRA